MWLIAADKRVEYAEHIYSITDGGNGRSMQLLCPTKHIRSRGDTLNCPTLTIQLEAEFDGVISVEVSHWSGALRRKPNFELFPEQKPKCDASITHGENGSTLTSGKLSATIGPDHHNFNVRFHGTDDGK